MNQQQLLAERYGKSAGAKRRDLIFGVTVAAIALGAFLVWSIFVTQSNADQPKGDAVNYKVISDHQVSVDFTVNNANHRIISCDIQALNEKYEIVGQRQVDFAIGATSQQALVNTVSKAVTGIVKSCWVK